MTDKPRIGLIDEFAELAEYQFTWDSKENALCHEMLRAYFATKKRADHLAGQIDALAKFLLEDCGGPDRSEGAVEMAMRLLREALDRAADESGFPVKTGSLITSTDPEEVRQLAKLIGYEDAVLGMHAEVWLVACRPYAEKVLGCETKEGLRADGMFFLDEEDARKHCDRANLVMRDAGQPPAFFVHRGLMRIERRPR